MRLVERVQEVSCCYFIRHDGDRIVNIPSVERRKFALSFKVFSMEDMKTLAIIIILLLSGGGKRIIGVAYSPPSSRSGF